MSPDSAVETTTRLASSSSADTLEDMTIQRMDNVGIVVDDLAAVTAFFVELGLELEGEMTVEGQWVDRVVGLDGVRNDIAMMRTSDGHGRLELTAWAEICASSCRRAARRRKRAPYKRAKGTTTPASALENGGRDRFARDAHAARARHVIRGCQGSVVARRQIGIS